MYPPTAPAQLVSLVESGLISLKRANTETFSFEKLHEGIEYASKHGGPGELTVLSVAAAN